MELKRQSIDGQVIIPAPYDKYYTVSDCNLDETKLHDDYQIGEEIEDYKMRVIAYLKPKPEYKDKLIESYPILTDNDEYPVGVMIDGWWFEAPISKIGIYRWSVWYESIR